MATAIRAGSGRSKKALGEDQAASATVPFTSCPDDLEEADLPTCAVQLACHRLDVS